MVQADEVFAGLDCGVEGCGFFAHVFFVVVCGFDGEADAALAFVHFDDAGVDFVADFEHVFDFLNTLFAELRDVDEAVDVAVEFHKRAEGGEFADGAFDFVADFVAGLDGLPRVFVDLFHAEADALGVFVDVDDCFVRRWINHRPMTPNGNAQYPIAWMSFQFRE